MVNIALIVAKPTLTLTPPLTLNLCPKLAPNRKDLSTFDNLFQKNCHGLVRKRGTKGHLTLFFQPVPSEQYIHTKIKANKQLRDSEREREMVCKR